MEDQATNEGQYPAQREIQQQGNYYNDPEGERFNNPEEYDLNSKAPRSPQPTASAQFNFAMPNFDVMRKKALEDAIKQIKEQENVKAFFARQQQQQQYQAPVPQPVAPSQPLPQQMAPPQPVPMQPEPVPMIPETEPEVIVIRRNPNVREVLLMLLIAVISVESIRFVGTAVTNFASRIEIRSE